MSSRWIHAAAAILFFMFFPRSGWSVEDAVDQAIAKIASYKFGESREHLTAVESLVLRTAQAPGEVDRLAAKLHPLLSEGTSPDCKQFLCRQLAILGSTTSIVPLTSLLVNEQLSDAARTALERIDDPAAGQALLKALGQSPKKTSIGIINSLGNREEKAAIGELIERSQSGDGEIGAAAIHALGKIGGEESSRVLQRLKEKTKGGLRINVLQATLACADKFAKQGETAAAKELYRASFAENEPVMIRVAALKGLVAVDQTEALSLILKHLNDPQPELQDVALKLVRNLKGGTATILLVEHLPQLSAPRQALLLRALADRDDRSILPTVLAALDRDDAEIRTAALYALGRVGGADAVKRLARVASAPAGPEQEVARESLEVLRGDDVDAAIVGLLEKPTVKTRAQLAAALGSRNSLVSVKTLLQTAKDPDPAVRLASVRALGNLAGEGDLPALVTMLQQAASGDELKATENSIVATARRITDPDRQTSVVLNALSESKDAGARVRLLPVVGQIGGARAIAVVDSALKDPDSHVREIAVRTLAGWSDPEALPMLLAIVKSSDLPAAQQLLALQGYIRLLGIPSEQPALEKLAAYREAFGLATRPDEKRQILSGLPRVRIPETLKFVLPLLADPDLKEDAARVAVLLSTVGRRSTISRDEARAAMRQVLAVTKTPAIRDAATAILESPER